MRIESSLLLWHLRSKQEHSVVRLRLSSTSSTLCRRVYSYFDTENVKLDVFWYFSTPSRLAFLLALIYLVALGRGGGAREAEMWDQTSAESSYLSDPSSLPSWWICQMTRCATPCTFDTFHSSPQVTQVSRLKTQFSLTQHTNHITNFLLTDSHLLCALLLTVL